MTGATNDFPAEIDPQDAFQVLSHELRLEILLALWRAQEYSLAFSELQTAVDERDSGKFTYHLEKLTGQFIKEIDGQYVLQYAGHRVIDAIQSGVFHTSPSIGPIEAPGTCIQCDTPPMFNYEEHLATVACSECDEKLVEYPFDPGGFQHRSVEEAVRAFDRRTKYKWRLASSGICFVCASRVDVDYVESAARMDHYDRYEEFFADDHPAVLYLSCRNCSFYSYTPVGVRLLDNPTVVGDLGTRGVNTTERPLWELPFITEADSVTIQNRDPWEILVEVPTPSGTLGVTLADDVSVQSVTVHR